MKLFYLKPFIQQSHESTKMGGGIYSHFGETTLVGCTVSNNVASGDGGAIYADRATLLLEDCSIHENEAEFGGGLFVPGCETKLNNCWLFSNIASTSGGAIYYGANTSSISVSDCTIHSNKAGWQGGGVGFNYGDATFSNCCINYNEAQYGGGLYFSYYIYKDYEDKATFYNCTIVDNTAEISGGGFWSGAKVLNSYNTIIARNTAPDWADVHIQDGGYGAAAYAYNTLSSYTDWTSGANNLIYDATKPLFKGVGLYWDGYWLATNSQAINKGGNQYVSTSVDLAGKTRIVGGTVDIGAYEYQTGSSALLDSGAGLFEEFFDELDEDDFELLAANFEA